MSGIKIRGTGSCLPGRVLTNSELARRVDTTDEWITTRTGIRERRICTGETHSGLCTAAARAALKRAGIAPARSVCASWPP